MTLINTTDCNRLQQEPAKFLFLKCNRLRVESKKMQAGAREWPPPCFRSNTNPVKRRGVVCSGGPYRHGAYAVSAHCRLDDDQSPRK